MNSYNKKRFTQYLLSYERCVRDYKMQYEIRQTRTSHQTMPYYVALDSWHHNGNSAVKFGETWDFRFKDLYQATKWNRYLTNLITRIQRQRKKQVDTATAVL